MIGERIKKLRLEKGYTLVELEKKSGVSYVQIGRYENNKAQPGSKVLNKLASALDVDVEFLIREETIIDMNTLESLFKQAGEAIKNNEKEKLTLKTIFELLVLKGDIKKKLAD